MKKITILIIWVFIIGLLASCGTIPRDDINEGLRSGVVFKRDMKVCVDDKCYEGVAVVPQAKSYKFEIEAYANLDLFEFSTCHREETTSDFGKTRWWSGHTGGKVAKGKYVPVPGMETDESCPVYFSGYNKNGRHSWGFVDFQSEKMQLPATVYCNGEVTKSPGVSVCQSREGLIQKIIFEEEVRSPPARPGCEITGKGSVWKYKIPRGECIHLFQSRDGRLHRLTTIGYEKIVVRE